MLSISSSELRDGVAVAGLSIAVASLVFTAINTRLTLRASRARFWLELRDRFSKHDSVHRRLRPGGGWSEGVGPKTAEEWGEVEAYMGLFEHCEVLLEEKLIDERTFKEIYAYRLCNLVSNTVVRVEKLIKRADGWKRFIELLKRMDIEIPRDSISRDA